MRRIARLPAEARLLLAVAAADPTGDPTRLRHAARRLGIPQETMTIAGQFGLLTLGERVQFRGLAARAAAYRSASSRVRETVHGALAEAIVRDVDQDHRAWHLAHATAGPDEDVAAELERTADRAQSRAGLSAKATFLERAALLTADPTSRSRRALAAAAALVEIDAADVSEKLLDMAEPEFADAPERAATDYVRALAVAAERPADAAALLLDAKRRIEPIDAGRARAAGRDAISAAIRAGGLGAAGSTVAEVVCDVRAAASATPDTRGLILEGVATCLGDEFPAGAASLRTAIATCVAGLTFPDERYWLPLACTGAVLLWDDVAWNALATRRLRLARAAGAIAETRAALTSLAYAHLLAGDLGAAEECGEQARLPGDAHGATVISGLPAALAALRAHQDPSFALIDRAAEDARRRGEGQGVAIARWAAAILHNALGQYRQALQAAEEAVEHAAARGMTGWALAEMIVAAVRCGQPDCAAAAVTQLSEYATASGTPWALGIRARSLALIDESADAEGLYQSGLDYLASSRARVDLARTHLLYGEWLRRQNRRVDARAQLLRAHQMLDAMGLAGFARRAERELLATGQTVRRANLDRPGELTAQERRIALLAADGYTNAEIGRELFLSRRTVEWHLGKVFLKLGITSRQQLAKALSPTGRRVGTQQPALPRTGALNGHVRALTGEAIVTGSEERP